MSKRNHTSSPSKRANAGPRFMAEIPTISASGAGPASDRKEVLSACNRLRQLLRGDDVAAVGLLDGHASLLQSAFPDRFPALDKAVRGHDFEEALAILEQALTRMGAG